ncbi:hypothetical protein [Rhizobium sp. IY2]|uniref:hypothetical protein n=1 Tax=Rhizobium sp. IY2 TaxID=3397853 RepID=UPI0039E057AF
MTDQNSEMTVPSLEMAERLLQQGETFLQAQFEAAIAADQRAMTMAAFFASVAAAIGAGAIAYWDKSGDLPILIAGLVGSGLMAIGACICLWAARPVDFFYPGTHPECWYSVLNRPLNEVLWGEAQNYQDNIEKNGTFLTQNSKALIYGASLSAVAPMVGIAAWLFFTAIYPSSPAVAALDGSRSPLFLDAYQHSSP